MSPTGILARNFWLIDGLLVAGVFLVFGRAIRGEFVFDDWVIVDWVPELRRRVFGGFARRMFRFPLLAGRSLTLLGFQWTYDLAGLRLEAWHGVNLAMHALSVLILHHLMLGWILPAPALAVAAVFAFHPLQVSSVCYISGRPNLQSVLFTLAGLLAAQLGAWPAAIASQWFAWKSKEDSLLYVALYPTFWFFFTGMPAITALLYGASVYGLILTIRLSAGFFRRFFPIRS